MREKLLPGNRSEGFMHLGFIGLGKMGFPMAENLLKGGHGLTVYNRSQGAPLQLKALGAQMAASPAELAPCCDIIFLMVPAAQEVTDVITGPAGLIKSLRPGALIVVMSSIDPGTMRALHGPVTLAGGDLLDAPVSGGEEGAKAATLAIMAGGSAAAFERALPALRHMGKTIVRCGELGAGQAAKLANQIIVAANMLTLSEALVFAKKCGADPAVVVQAIQGGLAGSRIMQDKAHRMLEGNFEPGGVLAYQIKDAANALATGHEAGVPLPITAMVMEALQSLKARGLAQQDHSVMVRYHEALAQIELSKE